MNNMSPLPNRTPAETLRWHITELTALERRIVTEDGDKHVGLPNIRARIQEAVASERKIGGVEDARG